MPSPTFSEQIIYQPAKAPEEPGTAYAGFKPSSIMLPKGHKRTSECRALPIDLIWDTEMSCFQCEMEFASQRISSAQQMLQPRYLR
jgi:hypothetical protein